MFQVLLVNPVEENISLNFRLRKMDELINYRREYSDEIKQNSLMSKKQNLNYLEHWVFCSLLSLVGFQSLLFPCQLMSLSIGIVSSAVGLNIFSIRERSKR